MKCCGKELPQGVPYVMLRYWCDTCKTEHLVHAREMSEYLAEQAKASHGALPDIL